MLGLRKNKICAQSYFYIACVYKHNLQENLLLYNYNTRYYIKNYKINCFFFPTYFIQGAYVNLPRVPVDVILTKRNDPNFFRNIQLTETFYTLLCRNTPRHSLSIKKLKLSFSCVDVVNIKTVICIFNILDIINLI
jgi:hypothetical protein